MIEKFSTPAAIVVGTLGGYADVRVADVQGPAAILLVAGCLLGAAHPEGAWRRALVLGLAVPVAQVVARVTGASLPYQVDHFALTFLALVPAFVGTYLGVAMRHYASRRGERPAP